MTAAVLDRVITALENSAEPGTWAGVAYRDTETRLDAARHARDIASAVDAKAAAEDVLSRTAGLPRAAQVSAAAAVRLAERTIGLIIRDAQDAGEIRRQGDNRETVPGARDVTGFATKAAMHKCYALADGISDEEFAVALTTARAEGNASHAAVLRQIENAQAGAAGNADWIPAPEERSSEAALRRRELIREYADQGWSSRQMSELLGILDSHIREIARGMDVVIKADQIVGRTSRGHNSAQIAEKTVTSLDGLADAVAFVDVDAIDPAQAQNWAASLTDSLRVLNRFRKQIEERAQ